MRILVPLPDRDFDVTEVAVPWRILSDAGHEVVFATENGATPAGDPLLLTAVLFGQLGAEREAKHSYGALTGDPAFQKPITWHTIDPGSFDALHLPGGHAPGMKQYLASELLQSKIAAFVVEDGRYLSARWPGDVYLLARKLRTLLETDRTV